MRSELTTDGLHLSPDGYDVWRSALEQIEFRADSTREMSDRILKLWKLLIAILSLWELRMRNWELEIVKKLPITNLGVDA